MTRAITKGSTDQSTTLFIIDNTTGLPATSLAYNSSGIDLWYRRQASALVSITEVTQTVSGAHTDGGFVHIANGTYRIDLPDAAVASGADFVEVGGTITGYTIYPKEIQLQAVNAQDAVRGGMTALPNANAEASGGLFTRGTGAGQINQDGNGRIDVNVHRWLTGTPNSLQSGRVDSYLGAVASGVIAAGSFAAGAFDAVWTVATRLLTGGTNIVLAKGTGVTGFNDLSAAQVNAEADTAIADAALATAANLATVDGNVDLIKAKTDNLPTDPADQSLLIAATDAVITAIGNLNNLSAAAVNAEVDQAITDAALATAANLAAAKTVVDSIKLKTDNLPASPAATSDIAAALATYDAPTKAELDAAVASLATAAALSSVAGNVTAIKVITDALTAVAAARLALSAGQIIPGTIDNTFTPTTTEFEADDITESTSDHYNGRVIIFTSGPLAGQATSISDYSLSSGRGHFTVVALTEAPSNDNTFIIV